MMEYYEKSLETVMNSGPSRARETFRVRKCPFRSLWGKVRRTRLGDLKKYLIVEPFVEIVLLSVIIGVISGLVSIVFDETLEAATNFFLRGLLSYLPPEPTQGWSLVDPPRRPWLLPLVVGLGGLLSGVLVYKFAPETEGHGTDAAIACFHKHAGKMRARAPLVKMLASVATIASGGSAGREGPMAQIGAGAASLLSSLARLEGYRRRLLVAVGIGSGIGTIFKAPLGGALFAAEVLYKRDFEVEAIIPAFIASTVGYAIYGFYDGYNPVFDIPQAAFNIPEELVFYGVLGVACGLMGRLYARAFYSIKSAFSSSSVPKVLRPALGGVLTGLVAILFPQVLGIGYGWLTLMSRGLFPITYVNGDWWLPKSPFILVLMLLVLCMAKILATSFTVGSGSSGGVFAPGLLSGAFLGAALAETFLTLFPTLIPNPDVFLTSFVVIGAMSLFAAASKAPIAVLLMTCEMTGGYGVIAPAMLSVALAYLLSGGVSIYREQVLSRPHSPAHVREYLIDVLETIPVREAMRKRFPRVRPNTRLNDVLRRLSTLDLRSIPVMEDGRLLGCVTFEDVLRVPRRRLREMRVGEIMRRRFTYVLPTDSLYTALKRMMTYNVDQLPVLDEGGRIVGVITRMDLIRAHDEYVKFVGLERKE